VNAPAPEGNIELDSEPTTPLIFHSTPSRNIHPCQQPTGTKRLTPFFVVSSSPPPTLSASTVFVGLLSKVKTIVLSHHCFSLPCSLAVHFFASKFPFLSLHLCSRLGESKEVLPSGSPRKRKTLEVYTHSLSLRPCFFLLISLSFHSSHTFFFSLLPFFSRYISTFFTFHHSLLFIKHRYSSIFIEAYLTSDTYFHSTKLGKPRRQSIEKDILPFE